MSILLRSSRYLITNALLVAFIAALALGGWHVPGVVILMLLIGGGIDEAVGDERDRPEGDKLICDISLYATLPLLAIVTFLMIRMVAQAEHVSLLASFLATDAKDPSPVLGAIYGTGYVYAFAGATVAHELSHRRTSALAQLWTRMLFALTLNPTFESTHNGHHRNVGTYQDFATARRGEYVLAFVVRTVTEQSIVGWNVEAERLRRKRLAVRLWRNRVLRGIFCSLVIFAAAAMIAGCAGIVAFFMAAVLGRVVHEMIAYVQHYGLVRAPNTRVEARHAWDCSRLISNALNYNLPRHADHHVSASKAFWELGAAPDSPSLSYGYETMATISLFPPLWHKLVDPLLADWDRRLASAGERALVRERGWMIVPRPGGRAQEEPNDRTRAMPAAPPN